MQCNWCFYSCVFCFFEVFEVPTDQWVVEPLLPGLVCLTLCILLFLFKGICSLQCCYHFSWCCRCCCCTIVCFALSLLIWLLFSYTLWWLCCCWFWCAGAACCAFLDPWSWRSSTWILVHWWILRLSFFAFVSGNSGSALIRFVLVCCFALVSDMALIRFVLACVCCWFLRCLCLLLVSVAFYQHFRTLNASPPPRMKLFGNQQLECLQGHIFSRQKRIYIPDPPSHHKKGSLPHNFHSFSNFLWVFGGSGYMNVPVWEYHIIFCAPRRSG